MQINFNIEPALIKRLVAAIERLANAYDDVHVRELVEARAPKDVDTKAGRSYYQNDRTVWEAEQKEKVRRMEEYGEIDT